MININLLTSKVAPKSSVVQASNTIKIIALIGTVIFFVGVLVMVAMFIINSQQIKSSIRKQEELKSSITSMQKTEQQYVLLKDRATIINKIYDDGNAADDLEEFYRLITSLPEGSSVSDMEVSVGKVESSFIFNGSQTLTNSLAIILSGDQYERIEMDTFLFSPGTGYKLTLTFLKSS